MRSRWRHLRLFLHIHGLEPTSRLSRFALYLLGVDLFLVIYQWVSIKLRGPSAGSVQGWITFLTFVSIILWIVIALRWFRRRIMWALRNRLVVTYIFIGVIPV